MITPKKQKPSLLQAKGHRNSKLANPKIEIQFTSKQNQYYHHAHSALASTLNLTNLIQPQTENNINAPLKLPQIGKKNVQGQQGQIKYDKSSWEYGVPQQIKRFQANPYLRKYVGVTSKQKLRRQSSCSFLNIVSVKPIFRSSTRMPSGKDFNQTVEQEKNEKIVAQKSKDNERIKTISHPHGQSSISKRSANVSIKQRKPAKKLTLIPKQSPLETKSNSVQKKKSMPSLRLQRPKQSPSYSEWCLFLGLLDGVIRQKQSGQYYKAFVGKGNNSVMVKNIIKNRPWWTLCNDQTDAHLYWTQSRNTKYLQALSQATKLKNLVWQKQAVMKLQLFGNYESSMSDHVREYTGIGLDKVLSKSQRQCLSKSSMNLTVYYPRQVQRLDGNKLKVHNHLQFNWNLSNKKALYYNLKSYYLAIGSNPFQYIPQTYHIQKEGDSEWNNFLKIYQKKTLWIVKPGENSNRGCGIDVVQSIEQIREIIKNKSIRPNGKERSHIVQRYLMPFLYNKRKFDIRCYMLVTSVRGNLRCYWYEQGYIRTASKEFTTKNLKNRMIHLTNDAVQKHSQLYGKYESGNKLSFNDFHKYIKNNHPELDFYSQVYPRMMQLATDAIRSTHLVIDARNRQFSFEVFGLDFMIDDKFQTWLIEVNTNPCLELSCPLLARIIPTMLQNALRIAVDPIFPPPKEIGSSRMGKDELFEVNRFTLIFSSREESDLQGVLGTQKLQNIIQSEDESMHDQE